jgi:cysteinyl-tRNA synthetase
VAVELHGREQDVSLSELLAELDGENLDSVLEAIALLKRRRSTTQGSRDGSRRSSPLIEGPVERGYANAVNGEVYSSVRSYPSYGALSRGGIGPMERGGAVQGAEVKRYPGRRA